MASVTIDGAKPALVQITSTESVLTLQVDREYTLFHTGLDVSGNSTTNTVYGDYAGDRVADEAADTDKLVLLSGKAVTIGPGLDVYKLKTASGSPVIQVIPGAVNVDNIRLA